MNDNFVSGDYIDFNQEWSYPLQWLYESMPARIAYQQWGYRVDLAMQGRPWRNLYQDELKSIINGTTDLAEKAKLEAQCLALPEGRSFMLAEAVQNAANQLASGVDTYEYQVNDPYGIIDDDTEANLAACCSQDYVKNNLGQMAGLFTRDLRRYGLSATLVTYDPKHQKNKVRRINPKNCWFDTMYSSTGEERFRGYSTMIDWRTLKKMVEDGGDEINLDIKAPTESIFGEDGKLKDKEDAKAIFRGRKIRSLNGLDIYVGDMNKLAVAPGLQGFSAEFYWDYDHDLRSCYNLNWYHTFATDPKAQTNSGYHGMDVELTVIYDLNRHIEFKIINRRYVISRNKSVFKRNVLIPITDPRNDSLTYSFKEFQLDCPLIFEYEEQDDRDKYPHPSSIMFSLLDLHDQLCSWRAKRDHVSKILSILRVVSNGPDADTLKKVFNINGIILDNIQGDITSVNLPYSYDPIDSQINQLEQMIRERLNSYSQFDAMQAMGDRASAAESGMALGAIAQGLATLQNAVMHIYSQVARQMIANRVVYSPLSEFPIVNEGGYSTVTIQEMALEAIVVVKSKMAKKIHEKMLATNAITLLGSLNGIFNEQGIAMLVEQATMGNIPRKMAATFMQAQGPSASEMALAQQQAQNDAMALQQNTQMYQDNPIPYEVDNAMANAGSPEEIDELIAQVSQAPDGAETIGVENLDMVQQDGSIATSLEGVTDELGAAMANPNSMV